MSASRLSPISAGVILVVVLLGVIPAAGWFSASGETVASGEAMVPPSQALVGGAEAHSAKEVSDRTRAAMLDGHPVRIRYAPAGSVEGERDYWCRPLSQRDITYALRQVARIRKTTDELFSLNEDDPVERERRMASLLRIRAMADAVAQLIRDGQGFMTRGYVPSLQSDNEWHYWSLRVYYKDEGELVLYAPIDLSQFPDVKEFRQRSRDIEEFANTHRAYEWNSLDYSERRKLVDSAIAAREELRRLRGKIEDLRELSGNLETDEAVRELRSRIHECQAIIGRAPPLVDQASLEWKFR